MLRFREDIEVHVNVRLRLTERGKYVLGSLRHGHNVFTATGRDWLSRLCAWQTIGSPDIPFTQRRVRWAGVGTGTQPEVVSVSTLVTPVKVTASPDLYLATIQTAEFPATQQVRFFKEFSESEISYQPSMVVPVTEAGLFVDIFPASTAGGTDDAVNGAYDTTLNPAVVYNSPVVYKTFLPLNKTIDFKLEIQWDFRFG